MADLSHVDTDELRERADTLLEEIDLIFKDLGPLLERLGRRRGELAVIMDELDKRDGKDARP